MIDKIRFFLAIVIIIVIAPAIISITLDIVVTSRENRNRTAYKEFVQYYIKF